MSFLKVFNKTTLLQQFTILTALCLALLGWFLSKDLIDFVENKLVEIHETVAITTIKSAIGHHIHPGDFLGDLPKSRKDHLDSMFKNVINEQIVLVKLWAPDGTVVYSTEKPFKEEKFPVSDDLNKAFVGHLKVEIHEEEIQEKYGSNPNSPLRNNQRYLEVYIPFTKGDSPTKVPGVLEVYWDLTLLDNQLAEVKPYILSLITAGFIILIIVLYKIVKSASNRIISQDKNLNILSLRLDKSMRKEQAAYKGLVNSLLTALDAKDQYTAGHSIRVADHAVNLGKKLNLPPEDLQILEEAGLFHDIGKIGVGDLLLQKPGKLSPEEYQIVKAHPVIGSRIIESMAYYGLQSKIVRYHHEHWDGSGYPEGLKGEDIPLLARILTVADVYDALTTDRPYRKGLTLAEARLIMEEGKGKTLDPELVDLFFEPTHITSETNSIERTFEA